MEFEQAKELVRQRLESTSWTLSQLDEIAMEAAWGDITYEAISKARQVNENSLKAHAAPLLWRKLSGVFHSRITKKSFRIFCETELKATEVAEPSKPSPLTVPLVGAALPNLEHFYGREEELAQTKKLLLAYPCIAIIGTEGIGKKSLVARLLCTEDLPFSKIIWKPLHHQPTADALEAELLELVGEPLGTSVVTALQGKELVIVLEALDSVITDKPRKLDDRYTSLIRRIVEETDAKLIVTSTEPIAQLNLLALRGKSAIFTLRGLKLQEARGIVGSDLEGHLERVWNATGGNPLMLWQIANWAEGYAQGLDPLIANRATVYRGLFEDLYEQTFHAARLSTTHRELLIAIADREEGFPFSELLNSHPNSALEIQRLIEMGLLQKTDRPEGPLIQIYEFFRHYLAGQQASLLV